MRPAKKQGETSPNIHMEKSNIFGSRTSPKARSLQQLQPCAGRIPFDVARQIKKNSYPNRLASKQQTSSFIKGVAEEIRDDCHISSVDETAHSDSAENDRHLKTGQQKNYRYLEKDVAETAAADSIKKNEENFVEEDGSDSVSARERERRAREQPKEAHATATATLRAATPPVVAGKIAVVQQLRTPVKECSSSTSVKGIIRCKTAQGRTLSCARKIIGSKDAMKTAAVRTEEMKQTTTAEARLRRAKDASPRHRTAAAHERSINRDDSLKGVNLAGKHVVAARCRRSTRQRSKVDSGLGSQKQVLTSPPAKHSALTEQELCEERSFVKTEEEEKMIEKKEKVVRQGERKARAGEDASSSLSDDEWQDSSANTLTSARPSALHGMPQRQVDLLSERHYYPQLPQQTQQHLLQTELQPLKQGLPPQWQQAWQCQKVQQQHVQTHAGTGHPSQLQHPWGVQQQQSFQSSFNSNVTASQQPTPLCSVQQQVSPSKSSCSPTSWLRWSSEQTRKLMSQQHPAEEQKQMHQQLQRMPQGDQRQQQQQHAPAAQTPIRPTHNCASQPQPTPFYLPKETHVRPPSPASIAWYLQAQDRYMRQKQGLLLTQQLATNQHTFANLFVSQKQGEPKSVPCLQQQWLEQQQHATGYGQPFHHPQPVEVQTYSQKQEQHTQAPSVQQQRPQESTAEQQQNMTSLPHVVLAPSSSCHPVHQQEGASPVAQPGQQRHYSPERRQQQGIQALAPPASVSVQGSETAAYSLHARSCQMLSRQRKHTLLQSPPYARARDRDNVSENRAEPFGDTFTPEQNQQIFSLLRSPASACVPSISPTTDRPGAVKPQRAAPRTASAGAASQVVLAGFGGHALHPTSDSAHATGKEGLPAPCSSGRTQLSAPTGEGYPERREGVVLGDTTHVVADRCPTEFAACQETGRPGDSVSAVARTAAASGPQHSKPQHLKTPSSAMHAHTPRWGRDQQGTAERSTSVIRSCSSLRLPFVPPPRSIFAVSAPPRPCAASAAVACRPPQRELLPPESTDKKREQRQTQQKQQRQQLRPGRVMYLQGEQQLRAAHERRRGKAVAAPVCSRLETKHRRVEGGSETGTAESEERRQSTRLSCFSFGYRRKLDGRWQERASGSIGLALISDRLSDGSVHDVRLVSPRVKPADANACTRPHLVPSAKARLVLNKLFEDATPSPLPARLVIGGRAFRRTSAAVATAAAKAAVTRQGAAAKPVKETAAAGRASERDAVASVVADAAASSAFLDADAAGGYATEEATLEKCPASAALATATSTAAATRPVRSATPSPKAVYRFRPLRSHLRSHSQSASRGGVTPTTGAPALNSLRAVADRKGLNEKKAAAELPFRTAKRGVSPQRSLTCSENVAKVHQHSSPRKAAARESQTQPHVVAADIRLGGGNVDVAAKKQDVCTPPLRKGVMSSLAKSFQPQTAESRQKQELGKKVTASGGQQEGGTARRLTPSAVAESAIGSLPAAYAAPALTEENRSKTSSHIVGAGCSDVPQSSTSGGGTRGAVPAAEKSIEKDSTYDKNHPPVVAVPAQPKTQLWQHPRSPSQGTSSSSSSSSGRGSNSSLVKAEPRFAQQSCAVLSSSQSQPGLPDAVEGRSALCPSANCYQPLSRMQLQGQTLGQSAVTYAAPQSTLHSGLNYNSDAVPSQIAKQPASTFSLNFQTPPRLAPSFTDSTSTTSFIRQSSNALPLCLPELQSAAAPAAAATPTAAQQHQQPQPQPSIYDKLPGRRYWSPPCRAPLAAQWRSCSSNPTVSLRRQAAPHVVGPTANDGQSPPAVNKMANNVCGTAPPPMGFAPSDSQVLPVRIMTNQMPAVAWQPANGLARTGGISLRPSWTMNKGHGYIARQQTPPPAAVVNATSRGLRQEPVSLYPSTSGALQYPCNLHSKVQGSHPGGNVSGRGASGFTIATARRQVNSPQPQSALLQRWGSAAVGTVASAAFSAAACNARALNQAPSGSLYDFLSSFSRS